MAKKLGNNYRLYVGDGATPTEAFAELAGQRDLTPDGSSSEVDISDKNSAPYGLKAPGNFDRKINVTGVLDLPDANGFTRVETLFKTQAPGNFQIRKSPFAAGDKVFEASCYVLNLSTAMPKDGEVTYSFTLTLAAAPSTDTLS
ncbi:MAG: hypothetical protein DCC73_15030 [Proteobacteria bacterium]|nr:MAG: hypothetical protein DCC73_15030 [Pseudomonadota bacterium]